MCVALKDTCVEAGEKNKIRGGQLVLASIRPIGSSGFSTQLLSNVFFDWVFFRSLSNFFAQGFFAMTNF